MKKGHTLVLTLKSRKVQISEKEDSVKEIGSYTHLLSELLAPVELAATELGRSEDRRNVLEKTRRGGFRRI